MAASVVYSHFNGRLVHEDRGGVERGYVPDPLGSTVALVDETGAITDEWSYWPYGEVASHTGSSTTQFTFVGTLGYYKDLVSSLTYVRARFYQAFIGQWMTMDPASNGDSAYVYSGASPTNLGDPSGLIPINWALIKEILRACGRSIWSGIAGIIGAINNAISGRPFSLPGDFCKLGTQCIAAVLGYLIAAAIAAATGGALTLLIGCIGGAISSILASLGSLLCDFLTKPCMEVDWICFLVTTLLKGFSGCLGGIVGVDLGRIEQVLWNSLLALTFGAVGKPCVSGASGTVSEPPGIGGGGGTAGDAGVFPMGGGIVRGGGSPIFD